MYICVVRDEVGETSVFAANTVAEINEMIAREFSSEDKMGVYVDEDEVGLYSLAGRGRLEKIPTQCYSIKQVAMT